MDNEINRIHNNIAEIKRIRDSSESDLNEIFTFAHSYIGKAVTKQYLKYWIKSQREAAVLLLDIRKQIFTGRITE